jgi:hypothetical protein
MPGQQRDEDYYNWLECPTWGWLCPTYQVEKEATIKNAVETIDNPFDSKFYSQSIPKRYSPAGKKASAKHRSKNITR